MTGRYLQRDDAGALLDFWNRNVVYDPLDAALLDEKIWGDADYDPSMTRILYEGNRVSGFAMGVFRRRGNAATGYIKLLAVHEPFRRQRLGSRLLIDLEEALWERGVQAIRVLESAPNYLNPGLDVRYTPALVFFRKHEYIHVGETYNMVVDLLHGDFETGADDKELARQGIQVRRGRPEDEDAGLPFIRRHWADWESEYRRCFRNDPISVHLAVDQEEVVAFSAYDSNNLGMGWFGPMGTAPSHRARGLGGILLLRCLSDQRAQGHATAIIPWVGPIAFYAQYAAARIDRVFHRLEKRRAD